MILAIETATEICSVAIVRDGSVPVMRSLNEKNIHSERLLSLIDECLATISATINDITALAVSIGPGSFTGLRIGLSTAKGLALARTIPVMAVPTLDGIAEAFRREPKNEKSGTFCAMIDAKRSEAYFAFYVISSKEIHRETEYHIKPKADIEAEALVRNATIHQPAASAGSIGLLAERNKEMYAVSDFSRLEPLYLREFVATMPKK